MNPKGKGGAGKKGPKDPRDRVSRARRDTMPNDQVGGMRDIRIERALEILSSRYGFDAGTLIDYSLYELHQICEIVGVRPEEEAYIGFAGHVLKTPTAAGHNDYHSDERYPHVDDTWHCDGPYHCDWHGDSREPPPPPQPHTDVHTDIPAHGDQGAHSDYHNDEESHNDGPPSHLDQTNLHGDWHCDESHQDWHSDDYVDV